MVRSVLSILTFSWCLAALAGQETAPSVQLRTPKEPVAKLTLVKDTFLEHEPIALNLVVENTTLSAITFCAFYPRFDGRDVQIAFDVSKSVLKIRPKPELFIGGGRRPIVELAKGDDWSMGVYLQRLLDQPKPGKYKLPFTTTLRYGRKVDGR